MKIFSSLIILIAVLLFSSCLKETEPVEVTYFGIGNVVSTDAGIVIEVLPDTVLYDFDFSNESISVGDRVMVLYNYIGTSNTSLGYTIDIQIKEIGFVDTKDVFLVDSSNRDTLVSDPVIVNSIEVINNYLNISFVYYNDLSPNYFELTFDSLEQSEGTYLLDFININKGISYDYQHSKIMSFNLNSFDWQGDNPIKLKFRYKQYSNYDKVIDLVYKQ